MATEGGPERAAPPAYNASAARQPPPNYEASAPATAQQVVVQQPAANIRYVDQNGNPVAPPQQQQVVVVQQPQPNIRYVDQNGNPVAAPTQAQPQPVIKYVDQNGNPVAPPVQQPQPQPVIKYVDQNGNPVAPPTNAPAVTQQPQQMVVAQPQQIMVNPNGANSTQQFAQGGGSCWRVALIVLWSIALAGGIPQFILGALILSWSYYYYYSAAYTLSMLLPGLVAIIGGSISIFGVNSYNYSLSIVSTIASGVLLLLGIILLMVEDGAFWFLIAYIPPFVLYSNIFAFSIIFTKHLSFVRINGHPDPNACCSCGDGGCCGPPSNQPVVYQQPGVALQVGVAQPPKDGVPTGTQQAGTAAAAPGQIVVMQQNVIGGVNNNMNVVSQEMMKNGGFCWKVTLIILWSFILAGAIPQLITGAILVSIYSNYYDTYYWDSYYWDQRNEYYQGYVAMWTMALLLPGIIGFISGPIAIYGVSKYNYKLNVFACMALGALLLCGLILFMVEYGAAYFFSTYFWSFVLYACSFGFNIKFTRKIGYIQTHGKADDINADCCKGCYDCCGCQRSCACCICDNGGCCQ